VDDACGACLWLPPAYRGPRRRPVFAGVVNDKRFRAIDSKTGKELWSALLDAAGNADPMTYAGKDGKQYVAIDAGMTSCHRAYFAIQCAVTRLSGRLTTALLRVTILRET
jgi:hypothetical protein